MKKFSNILLVTLCLCLLAGASFAGASAYQGKHSGHGPGHSGSSHGEHTLPAQSHGSDRPSRNESWQFQPQWQGSADQTPNQYFASSAQEQQEQMTQPPAKPGSSDSSTNTENSNSRPSKPGENNDSYKSERNGKPGGKPGSDSSSTEYSAANTVTEDSSNASYSSSADSENAVLVSGKTVTITDATVNKTGSSSGDSADFYGINAAVLAKDGSTLTISGTTVTTDGSHANGIFSYGNGTTVNVSDTTITTSGNNSGGLMITGGAALNASNLNVSTTGNSSAAIRSDRGGGTVNVSGGTYSSAGVGSPAIYSTADITVSNATLSSAVSEAVVIEGGNSVTLNNVDITGSNSRKNGQSTVSTNVLIYQSMSGDAAEGNSTFTMSGGTMTSQTGAMFHVTNVTTEINLSGVSFNYSSDSNVFLDASADAWGTSGKNGGNVTLNLNDQTISGAILQDNTSSVAVNLSGTSTWTLQGDSFITSFSGDLANVNLNGYTLYINGVAYNG